MNALAQVGNPSIGKRRRPRQPAWMKGTTREELIGLSRDGRKLLWSTGQVRPITRFPRTASGQIASAKYVLDWKGHRITAHCSQTYTAAEAVEVQIMCGGGISVLPIREAEGFLRGVVVNDPAEVSEMRARMARIMANLEARNDTPSRQRGSILDDANATPERKGRTTRSIPQVMVEGGLS